MLAFVLAAEAAHFNLSREVEGLLAPTDAMTAETCAPILEQVYTGLEAMEPSEADLGDVVANGAWVVQRSWAARVALHGHLRDWHQAGQLTAECMRSTRRADLALRYLEDYVLEALPEGIRPPDWLTNPSVPFAGREGLESGDVLVTRANALSSAGIAHMGRVDSQFSHNVLVYVDERRRAWAVMAYLEQGALVEPMDEFLSSGVDRVVVLRHPDRALAAKAAHAAWDRIANGEPIDYDADFDYDDHSALFCSEIARWAFGELSGLPDTIPIELALSRFDREHNRAMFDAIGVDRDVTSAPADLLFDPTFDLVAEWRHVDDLSLLRRYDAVVESAMTWMEERDYELEVLPRHERFIEAALAVRRTPMVGRLIKKRIHPNGDLRFLVGAWALQEAITGVEEDLYAALGDDVGPVSYAELRTLLEQVRVADLERWKTDPGSSHFTELLHPR